MKNKIVKQYAAYIGERFESTWKLVARVEATDKEQVIEHIKTSFCDVKEVGVAGRSVSYCEVLQVSSTVFAEGKPVIDGKELGKLKRWDKKVPENMYWQFSWKGGGYNSINASSYSEALKKIAAKFTKEEVDKRTLRTMTNGQAQRFDRLNNQN
jgi:hypothetical protein